MMEKVARVKDVLIVAKIQYLTTNVKTVVRHTHFDFEKAGGF